MTARPCAALPGPRLRGLAAVVAASLLAAAPGPAPPGPAAGPGEGVTVLWTAVSARGHAERWRRLGGYASAAACDAARRNARDAAWKGFGEAGVRDLAPVGDSGFLHVDPRTLDVHVFRFVCRPGAPVPAAHADTAGP